MENTSFYTNFNLKYSVGVKFIACNAKMKLIADIIYLFEVMASSQLVLNN